jgi:hypothetical protein
MKASPLPTRRSRSRTIGASAGVMILAVSAFLSGCYYRGRPPEYGRRDYGDHRHDHDRDRHY